MEKYEFGSKDVLWCQIENWYPIFKRFCPKTEFFPLDKSALNYLKSNDSIVLPEEEPEPAGPQPDIFGQIDSDDAFSDWSTDEEAESVPHVNPVPDLCRKIRRVIGERARKAVVPKLNWSCPSDALHFSPDQSLKSGMEI
ncbi:Oidioi.mRNA.OKI2018_I69.chr2.g6091.t1.cds [Oikopleura dioica]|uniref:Translation initiation factor eIF2 assembly protein n=1 Tax=Oikopleura dioica TaxID=34765 RepID=A0ABN7T6S1_OIKDI|nr:Oidioi.mRNA.OKI2018_I69.chr2.g6091.t1.cds [Oikopleura dioica]